MTETTAEKKHITIGILAHVDAGKTTLSEELLYETGVRKQAGRVDNGDTLLDHDEMERSRGITIFSKQAELSTAETVPLNRNNKIRLINLIIYLIFFVSPSG